MRLDSDVLSNYWGCRDGVRLFLIEWNTVKRSCLARLMTFISLFEKEIRKNNVA